MAPCDLPEPKIADSDPAGDIILPLRPSFHLSLMLSAPVQIEDDNASCRHTAEPVRFVMGMSLLARLLEEQIYHELPGRLLEGLGKFLAVNAKLYAYPMPRDAVVAALGPAADRFGIEASAAGEVTADGIHPRPPVDHLYRYLRQGGWVVPVSNS